MSHVTLKEAESADQQIVDLTALELACRRVGLEFRRDKHTFRTYATDHGRLVGDYPVPGGYSTDEVVSGACEHAIGLPGMGDKTGPSAYEIGVVKSKKFPGTFSLMYDFWGGHIDQHAGNGLGDLLMHYNVEACRRQADINGDMFTTQVLPSGEIVGEIDTTVRLGY